MTITWQYMIVYIIFSTIHTRLSQYELVIDESFQDVRVGDDRANTALSERKDLQIKGDSRLSVGAEHLRIPCFRT